MESRSLLAGFLAGALTATAAAGVVAWALRGRAWQPVPADGPQVHALANALPEPPDPHRKKDAQVALEAGQEAVTQADWERALAHGAKALELDGNLADAHKLLGLAYWRSGDVCQGRQHFERFVAMAPSSDPMVARVQRILETPAMKACASAVAVPSP